MTQLMLGPADEHVGWRCGLLLWATLSVLMHVRHSHDINRV